MLAPCLAALIHASRRTRDPHHALMVIEAISH
jgi:hypothetical protein